MAADERTVAALERAALQGWPATVQRAGAGGWMLRATPGLDRGRSNHALPPARELAAAEIAPALEEVRAFARCHGIRPGIQVSPLHRHTGLSRRLDAEGWEADAPTLVLAGPRPAALGRPGGLTVRDHADAAWLAGWRRCEPGRDVEAHAATVFAALRGRALFACLGSEGVGLGVPYGPWLGLFCLAVAPERRRAGVGTRLVRLLLAAAGPGVSGAYLQVQEGNAAARALYARLGFREAYRYQHRAAAAASAERA